MYFRELENLENMKKIIIWLAFFTILFLIGGWIITGTGFSLFYEVHYTYGTPSFLSEFGIPLGLSMLGIGIISLVILIISIMVYIGNKKAQKGSGVNNKNPIDNSDI